MQGPVREAGTVSKEVELFLVDVTGGFHDFNAQLKGKEQFVGLEEAAASVFVHGIGVEVVDVITTLRNGHIETAYAAAVDRQVEEVHVRVQGELVHRID